MEYMPTIGLEIHAELRTKTKMFCNSKNDPNETRPNVNICPVCLAHPGSLPAINREAVNHVLRVGSALKGQLADYTEFDRKNYFYPDLPKGYQISQYEYPLVSGGVLNEVPITRIHLEEDTASSMHDNDTGLTTIDFNRAGVPLMELVTEPVMRSAEEAGAFARELQLLLRYLGASEANMEKGEMRVEANISVQSKVNSKQKKGLGTKVEIKNLNSFRIMEKAVAYEIERQTKLLESGGKVVQETRGWDDRAQKTFPQRIKEVSADYRYFPDPDLPSLNLSEISKFNSGSISHELPQLPRERREKYLALGIKADDAALFVREPVLGNFFDQVIAGHQGDSKKALLSANYIANDLVNLMRGMEQGEESRDMQKQDTSIRYEIPISAEHFKEIIDMLAQGEISSRAAKDLLKMAINQLQSPRGIAENMGLMQSGDSGGLEVAINEAISSNPKVVSDYVAGKDAALGFLIGVVMKARRGGADPVLIRKIMINRIKEGN